MYTAYRNILDISIIHIYWVLLFMIINTMIHGSTYDTNIHLNNCTIQIINLNQRSFTFPCKLAQFGGYITDENLVSSQFVFPKEQYGCVEITSNDLKKKIVLLKRGECPFDQKLMNVQNAHGMALIVVNNDDTLLDMSSFSTRNLTIPAVSIGKKTGAKLQKLFLNSPQALSIHTSLHKLDICFLRIKSHMTTNNPFLAVEVFESCAQEIIISTDIRKLLKASLDKRTENITVQYNFWKRISIIFQSRWEVTNRIILLSLCHIFHLLQSNHLQRSYANNMYYIEYNEILEQLGNELFNRGYFEESLHYFQQIKHVKNNQLNIILVHLIQANIKGILPLVQELKLDELSLTSLKSKYWLIDECLKTIFKYKNEIDENAITCLSDSKSNCCQDNYQFNSSFIEQVFLIHSKLGVYLDEVGAFSESLLHFQKAFQLCGEQTRLETRINFAIPIVVGAMDKYSLFLSSLDYKINTLKENIYHHHPTSSVSIEKSHDLLWTITPPTMFLGYQGLDVVKIKENIFEFHLLQQPSLSNFPLISSIKIPKNSQTNHFISIGFISSWFRSHSVGKLMLGVIQKLNRSKFHIVLFQSTHFFQKDDEMTKKFQNISNEFIFLSSDRNVAIKQIQDQNVDIVVYPELGMDAFVLYLAYQRFTSIQCVFWGHPITTGMETIDYFISSEYFISDFFEDPKESNEEKQYHHVHFSEQMILFQALSTSFQKPVLEKKNSFDVSIFSLPHNKRIYFIPQTLMKFHVSFDDIIKGILNEDNEGIIVLLYSTEQELWKERLLERFQINIPKHWLRIYFIKKMNYSYFLGMLLKASVVLDPFPFGGGVTTLDAFSMGTPVVTLPSHQTVVELAAGFYRYMGINCCIVQTKQEYIQLSIRIAMDKEYRNHISTQIIDKHHLLYEDDQSVHEWEMFFSHVIKKKKE